MAAKGKASSGEPPAPLWALLLRPPIRNLLLLTAGALALLVGLQIAWKKWGDPALHNPAALIAADKIVVTPQPAWIEPRVKDEVLRDASLGDMRLHDRRLLQRLHQAFSGHSWVEKVVQVSKAYPAQINVELVYRRPAALVEVNYRRRPELLLVDGDGVLLPSPSEEFSKKLPPLLRIAAGDVAPAGVYGTPWGDPKIEAAAVIAHLWGDRWQGPALYRIAAEVDGNGVTTYFLELKEGARIAWGSAPGRESAAEPAPEAKIAALLARHAQTPLSGDSGALLLDLRQPNAPQGGRTAKAPAAKKR